MDNFLGFNKLSRLSKRFFSWFNRELCFILWEINGPSCKHHTKTENPFFHTPGVIHRKIGNRKFGLKPKTWMDETCKFLNFRGWGKIKRHLKDRTELWIVNANCFPTTDSYFLVCYHVYVSCLSWTYHGKTCDVIAY